MKSNFSIYTSSQEMEAYDRLPQRLRNYLRTCKAGFEATEVEKLFWGQARNDVDLTIKVLEAVTKDAFKQDRKDQDLSDMRRL
jgi:hypothetical protein